MDPAPPGDADGDVDDGEVDRRARTRRRGVLGAVVATAAGAAVAAPIVAEDRLEGWAEDREQGLDRVTPIRVSRRASGLLTDTSSDFVDWFGEGEVSNVAEAKAGTGSVRVVTPRDSEAVANALREFDPVDMSGSHLKLWVRVDDWDALGASQVRLQSTETAFFHVQLGAAIARPARVDGEWTEVVLPRSAFTGREGEPRWSSITALAFTAWSPVGTTVELLACQAVRVPDSPAPGVVSLTFDDGWASQYRAAQLMDQHGWVGTAYLISERLGSPGYLTYEQVEDLHDRGWDIGGHDDVPLRSLDDAELLERVGASAAWLRERNFRGRQHFAYPNGSVDDRVAAVVRRFFVTGRTINPVNQSLSWVQEQRLTGVSVFADQAESEVRGMVDAAAADGDWANLVFHKIGDEGDDLSWTEERFRSFLEYVAASGAVVQPLGGVL
ncbi:polysaccharide deacetylase family protein [Nocardioides dongkuii]|uniref:polysaccharide deacetylase family protein n=1 Tax=Nocardioides dongkuii TaxID=2760089 RepID=UPI0015FC0F2D|nr:polysaccharide deacetylase family protein [Nocardioides dongkuii]